MDEKYSQWFIPESVWGKVWELDRVLDKHSEPASVDFGTRSSEGECMHSRRLLNIIQLQKMLFYFLKSLNQSINQSI